MINKGLMFVVYLATLCYLFLGISIVADIFMGAIEVITSQTKEVTYEDEDGVERKAHLSIWNPTIANLTLMALGSSAPEILLAIIETCSDLGGPPGELGTSSIVGSAAYNLLVISAVCVLSVPTGTVKKIQDMGVFLVTAITSTLAYVWMYIVLEVWSAGVIESAEAWLTLSFFVIFLICAYIADKINEKRRNKEEKNKLVRQRSLPTNEFFHILNAKAISKSQFHLNILVTHLLGIIFQNFTNMKNVIHELMKVFELRTDYF